MSRTIWLVPTATAAVEPIKGFGRLGDECVRLQMSTLPKLRVPDDIGAGVVLMYDVVTTATGDTALYRKLRSTRTAILKPEDVVTNQRVRRWTFGATVALRGASLQQFWC